MAHAPMGPGRRRWLPRFMRAINVPMRLALQLPFETPLSKQLMLLTFTGRRTGRLYRQPVSYVTDGDTLLTPGGGKWKWNLRADEPIHVRLRGRAVLARPEFVREPGQVEDLLRRMQAVNPRITFFAPVTGADGQIDRESVEAAVRHGFTIIRWRLGPARAQ